MDLSFLELSIRDNKLSLRIPTFDFIDNESEVMEFLGTVPELPIHEKEVSYHSCGAYLGSCDCPIIDSTEMWVNEEYPLTSVDDVSGFNFVILGEVKDFIENTNEPLQVYYFESFEGMGLCFKQLNDRFKYAKAIIIE